MSATSHRRIVIGDVHGHYQGLMQLLEAIAPTAEDQIYFLGDLIDRDPRVRKWWILSKKIPMLACSEITSIC